MTHAVFGVVNIVMRLAPIGAFGAMAFTIGSMGLPLWAAAKANRNVLRYLHFLCRGNSWRRGFGGRIQSHEVLLYIKEEILLVLATSSSEPALPTLMEKLERLGCSKSLVGLVVPTGYTFNTDGSSLYMTLAALFVAQATGTHLTLDNNSPFLWSPC